MATRETWTVRVLEWKRSGLTAAVFAEREGINAGTLTWWSSKLGRAAGVAARPPVLEVKVEAQANAGALEDGRDARQEEARAALALTHRVLTEGPCQRRVDGVAEIERASRRAEVDWASAVADKAIAEAARKYAETERDEYKRLDARARAEARGWPSSEQLTMDVVSTLVGESTNEAATPASTTTVETRAREADGPKAVA